MLAAGIRETNLFRWTPWEKQSQNKIKIVNKTYIVSCARGLTPGIETEDSAKMPCYMGQCGNSTRNVDRHSTITLLTYYKVKNIKISFGQLRLLMSCIV